MVWLARGLHSRGHLELSTFFWCIWKVSQELSENVAEWHTVYHPLSWCSPARVPVSGKAWLELVSCSWLKNAGWAVLAGHRSAAHCSGITRPLAQHSPVGSQLARS